MSNHQDWLCSQCGEWHSDHPPMTDPGPCIELPSPADDLVGRCKRYAAVIEGIIVVPDDWTPENTAGERREPKTTLLEAATELTTLRAQLAAAEASEDRWMEAATYEIGGTPHYWSDRAKRAEAQLAATEARADKAEYECIQAKNHFATEKGRVDGWKAQAIAAEAKLASARKAAEELRPMTDDWSNNWSGERTRHEVILLVQARLKKFFAALDALSQITGGE